MNGVSCIMVAKESSHHVPRDDAMARTVSCDPASCDVALVPLITRSVMATLRFPNRVSTRSQTPFGNAGVETLFREFGESVVSARKTEF